MVGGLLFGGWYFYSTPGGKRLVKSLLGGNPAVVAGSNNLENRQPTQGTGDSASKAQYTVSLASDPIGARIYIDGKDTEAYTPNRRSLEANKDYVITLKKDGYLNYEGTIRATQNGQSFTMSMQPAQKAGYISINVPNGGLNTVIYVNGIRLGERPPISKYAIPAGFPVKISAYDPFYKMSAEQTVKVDANQKKSIELILGVDQRKPSGQ